MKGGTLFSGIDAPEVAAPWIDWCWRAEIDAFANAVSAHHRPGVPNLGDVSKIDAARVEPVDLLVFGSPCQSFSIAGKRLGLDDPRGNLALVALGLARQLRPDWLVFENVPGLLSSDEGRDFGAFLTLLGECGYGWAYRVLDAQHFGVPQRRRRVFVVGHLGDWRRAAAVLFERESLSEHPAPRREAGEGVAGTLAAGAHPSGFNGRDAALLAFSCAFSCKDHGADTGDIAPTLRAMPHDASHANAGGQVAVAFGWQNSPSQTMTPGEVTPSLDKSKTPAVSLAIRGRNGTPQAELGDDKANALLTPNGGRGGIGVGAILTNTVRRLTPRECERLQGFPDDYTLVPYRGKPAADGPRYRALGNSMAVPVMRWILERLSIAQETLAQRTAA